MKKELKELYRVLLLVILIMWLSSIGMLRAQIGVSVTKYFVLLLSVILVVCGIDYIYKFERKMEKVEDFSLITPALGLVSCFMYLAYLGFWLGRFFVRFFF